jgi:chorismate mutase/prephenate dehydratase
VALLFREIMSACLALERPITVAYLGPRGTFSESAAFKHFGHGAVGRPAVDRRGVSARRVGRADFGVVPVENSTEGAVGRSLDLMPQTPMRVCGEVIVRIHHKPHGEGAAQVALRCPARVLAPASRSGSATSG